MLCVERGRTTSRRLPAVPFGLWLLKKLLFRASCLNYPPVKRVCGAPKTGRPWRNKPRNLIFAPKSPRATPIRLVAHKRQAFVVYNTPKPAFREALVPLVVQYLSATFRPLGRAGIPFFAGVVRKIIRARAIKNRCVFFACKTRKPLLMAPNRRAGGCAKKRGRFCCAKKFLRALKAPKKTNFALTREN